MECTWSNWSGHSRVQPLTLSGVRADMRWDLAGWSVAKRSTASRHPVSQQLVIIYKPTRPQKGVESFIIKASPIIYKVFLFSSRTLSFLLKISLLSSKKYMKLLLLLCSFIIALFSIIYSTPLLELFKNLNIPRFTTTSLNTSSSTIPTTTSIESPMSAASTIKQTMSKALSHAKIVPRRSSARGHGDHGWLNT